MYLARKGINLNLVSAVFGLSLVRRFMESSRRCGNCGKAGAVLCGGFCKQLEEMIKKKLPKATLLDFLSCGSFHSAPRPLFFLETPREQLDRFCRLKKEMPQAATWGLTRVINDFRGVN